MKSERNFSITNFLIKLIIIIIAILFIIWVLSKVTSNLSKPIDVMADNIYAENVDRMKNVGKEYFTTERLPKENGKSEKITLEELYDKNLILPLKDKNGKECSAKNSYISVEKQDNEYLMKVYLDCNDNQNYINAILGCHDLCNECTEKEPVKTIEYQYKLSTDGKWSDWSNWSDWTTTSVTKSSSVDVETKVSTTKQSYTTNVTNTKYVDMITTCADGYEKSKDGKSCEKIVTSSYTKDPVCKAISGYTLTSRDGFNCTYTKKTTTNSTCPAKDGYSVVNSNGNCIYSKETTTNSTCPAKDGYSVVNSNGTCIYTKKTTTNPTCPTGTILSGNTCIKTETIKENLTCPTGTTLSGNTCIKTETIKENLTCPQGSTLSGDSCIKTNTINRNATCKTISGYTLTSNIEGICTYTKEEKTNPTCPTVAGYKLKGIVGSTCSYQSENYVRLEELPNKTTTGMVPSDNDNYIYKAIGTSVNRVCNDECQLEIVTTYSVSKKIYDTTTKTAVCATGYTLSGSSCVKNITNKENATCPSVTGYTLTNSNKGICTYTNKTTSKLTCPAKTGYTVSQTNNACTYTKQTKTNLTCPAKTGYTVSQINNACTYTKQTKTQATCPKGSTLSNGKCTSEIKETKTATCPVNTKLSGTVCVGNDAITQKATCPQGSTLSGNNCIASETKVTSAICETGKKVANGCFVTGTTTKTSNIITTCPLESKLDKDKNMCSITTTNKAIEYKDVVTTLYRSRTRKYTPGTVDIKWSKSKNDKTLLDAKYVLTGVTR